MSDTLERDAGFCSGADDDDIEAEDGIHSPTDASEDSVDVKVRAISLRNKNKRKSAEPRRLDNTDLPAKKRKIDLMAVKIEQEEETSSAVRNCSPFRPWSTSPSGHAFVPNRHPSLLVRPEDLSRSAIGHDAQDEPLSLVSKKRDEDSPLLSPALRMRHAEHGRMWHAPVLLQSAKDKTVINNINNNNNNNNNRVRNCKTFADKKVKAVSDDKPKTDDNGQRVDNKFRIDALLSTSKDVTSRVTGSSKPSQGGQQRNYKNMTRERRIEANARERTRVHTISAAFDTLRHSIPAYSHNQKLSKLSVLRIACSYIMTLSRLAGYDYSKDQSEPEISNCVENVSKTIQTEGKIRKKKDD